MLIDERAMIEAVAASVFIAAASWGAVNSMLVVLASVRYAELRADRFGQDSSPEVPVRSFVLHPVIVASVGMWPGALVFYFYWRSGSLPGPLGWVLLASWPAVAVVLLTLASRSPWAPTRRWLQRAAGAKKPEVRDEFFRKALEADPARLTH